MPAANEAALTPRLPGVLVLGQLSDSKMITATACTLLFSMQGPAPVSPDVTRGPTDCDYTVRATTTTADERGRIPLEVSLRLRHPAGRWTVVEMPVWTPGSYRYRDFPERVTSISARGSSGQPLDVAQLDRSHFGIAHGAETALTIDYRVELDDQDRFMQRGPQRRCLTYEGPQVYLRVRGADDAPCTVHFDLPPDWRIASGLVETAEGSFFAADYDFLADCPVKLGVFQDWSFECAESTVRVVVDATRDLEFDHAAWLTNLRKVTEVQASLFGGLPSEHYTFLFTASRTGHGGGLEHLTSTAIGVPVGLLLASDRAALSTVAHEFFHLWNVKRARPAALGPFDYGRANRTTMLWLCEGVTSYYTTVTMARAGLSSEEEFWNAMAGRISAFESTPARRHVSSSMASDRVWDELPTDRNLSYYTSGQVLGLLLDVQIRSATANTRSLDDLMRALFRECMADDRGYEDADVERLLLQLTGLDFTPWFDAHVRGTQVPDYAGILASAGVVFSESRSERFALRGLHEVRNDDLRIPWWIDPNAGSDRNRMRSQGRIVALDGAPIATSEDVQNWLESRDESGTARVALLGPGDRELEVTATVEAQPRVRAHLELLDADSIDPPEPTALAIRRGILSVAGR